MSETQKQNKDTPNLLEKFELGNQIVSGSFYAVYKVNDKNTGDIYAAKISISSINDSQVKQEIKNEVNILSRLNHPGVIRLIFYSPHDFKYEPKPTIITEYASNDSLYTLLENERKSKSHANWDFTHKLITLYGISSAMSFLHSKNILHRNLKPSNILMDEHLHPKISNFRLSIIENDGNIKRPIGTPIYMAPEIFDKFEYSKSSDVYAFSMIMYEIITNEKPFEKEANLNLSFKVMSGERPQFNSDILPAFEYLIESCWDQDPSKRPTFSDITDQLRNDPGFRDFEDFNDFDNDEYEKYIDFIDDYNCKFYQDKKDTDITKYFISDLKIFKTIKLNQNEEEEADSSISLEKFELGNRIGIGSSSKVYKARDKNTGIIYAAKISKYSIDESKTTQEIENEVNILSRLDHPGVIRFIFYSPHDFKYEPKPTIITEYALNDSLYTLLENERKSKSHANWDFTHKLITLYGISSTMSFLHSKNILHRNLKPSNILMDEHLHPKISNFKLSIIENAENIKRPIGTPIYMAPEIFDKFEYSKSSDVYAFSMIMYEIITNERPFEKEANLNLSFKVMSGERPQFNKDILPAFEYLIESCWDQDPSKRPTFSDITDQLRNDPGFRDFEDFNDFNNDEYEKYIDFIDDYNCKFYQDEKDKDITKYFISDLERFKPIKSNQKEEEEQQSSYIISTDSSNESKNLKQEEADSSIFLEKFELEKKIGEGSFSKVYKARDKNTEIIYTAKISIYSIDESQVKQEIENEVNIISKLDHPGVIKFIFYSPHNFKYEPKPTIITEYAPNDSLYTLLDKERKSIPHVNWDFTHKLITLYGISSAMSFLHSKNILHRNLKPSNILMDEHLYPKISNFRLSIIENDKTMAISLNSALGTPIYMAPEIWNKLEYSKSSDVYAFSMIMYEIITNEIPFENHNYFSLTIKIHSGERPPFKNDILPSFKHLIESCWNEDPSKRPTFSEIAYQLKNNHAFREFDGFNDMKYEIYINFIDHYIEIEDYFNHLDENHRNLIKESKDNPIKQCIIGQMILEGIDGFPINPDVGSFYLNKSIDAGCTEACNYYCNLMIKGYFVNNDLYLAKKYLETQLDSNDGTVFFLYGKVMKKLENFIEAIFYFRKAIIQKNNDAMYEYAKMLYNGDGCEMDKEKANLYLDMAKKNGNCKAYDFISKQKEKEKKKEEI